MNSDMVAQMAGMRNFESPHTLTPLGGTRLTGDSSLANQTTLKIEGTEFLANEAEQGGAVIVHQHTPEATVLGQAIQHLLGHRLGDPKADPSLLPAMREGMEQLAIRDADQRLVDLLQSLLD